MDRQGTPGAGPLGESGRAWLALGVGVLAVSAHSALSYGMSPLMKPITDELGWSRSGYAAAMNFRMLLLMAVAPWAGSFVDRFGARSVLAGGALLMGMGTIGLAGMHSLAGLYAASAVVGPGQACIGSVAGSALVLRLFRRRRGLAVGILNGGDNFITSGVHMASAALLVHSGWRAALWALGLGYLALAVLIRLALRAEEGVADATPAGGAPAASLRAGGARGRPLAAADAMPWRDPSFWFLVAAYVPIYAFITTVGIHFPAHQRDLGRSPEVASYIYGLTTLVGALGSVAFGWFSERASARSALLLTVVGLAATSVFLWVPLGLPATYAWAVAYGVANAGAVALLALVLNECFGPARIGRLMGVAMVFCMGGTIAGNFLAAGVFDRFGSYDPVWRVYTALMVLALLPVVLLWRRPLGDGRSA